MVMTISMIGAGAGSSRTDQRSSQITNTVLAETVKKEDGDCSLALEFA